MEEAWSIRRKLLRHFWSPVQSESQAKQKRYLIVNTRYCAVWAWVESWLFLLLSLSANNWKSLRCLPKSGVFRKTTWHKTIFSNHFFEWRLFRQIWQSSLVKHRDRHRDRSSVGFLLLHFDLTLLKCFLTLIAIAEEHSWKKFLKFYYYHKIAITLRH